MSWSFRIGKIFGIDVFVHVTFLLLLVGEVMQREFQTADPLEMAEGVFARLHECNCTSLPVLKGRLVGILTAENLGEFLMIQAALRGGAKATA